jgi:release factor glutamine methyltransferase
VTILEVIQRSADFLGKKGVSSPRLQVELLLAHLLKMPRMNLYLNFERPLNAQEVETLRELVRRRGQREPLQYIVGSVSFCGLELNVSRRVLVPRPETELLAERAWNFLAQLPAPWIWAPAAVASPSPWPRARPVRAWMPLTFRRTR